MRKKKRKGLFMNYERKVEEICSLIEKMKDKKQRVVSGISLSDDENDQEILAEMLLERTKSARNFTLEGPFDPVYCTLTDYEKFLITTARPTWEKNEWAASVLKPKVEDAYYQFLGVLLRTDIKICDRRIQMMDSFYQENGFQKPEEIQMYYDFLLRRDLLGVTLEEVKERDSQVLSRKYDWRRDLVNVNNETQMNQALENFHHDKFQNVKKIS